MTEAARTLADRQWIIDLIHNEYDKAPDYFRAGDNWDDGTERIADQVIERFRSPLPGTREAGTIGEYIELMHRAKSKVERAKRNQNAHGDIQIMDDLISLVETLQESLRNSAHAAISNSAAQTEADREYASELLADLANADAPRLEVAAQWFRKARVENALLAALPPPTPSLEAIKDWNARAFPSANGPLVIDPADREAQP